MAWHERLTEEVNEIFEQLGGVPDVWGYERDDAGWLAVRVHRDSRPCREPRHKARIRKRLSRPSRAKHPVAFLASAAVEAGAEEREHRQYLAGRARALRAEGLRIADIAQIIGRSVFFVHTAIKAAA